MNLKTENQCIYKLKKFNEFNIFDEQNYVNTHFNTNYQTFKCKIIEKEV